MAVLCTAAATSATGSDIWILVDFRIAHWWHAYVCLILTLAWHWAVRILLVATQTLAEAAWSMPSGYCCLSDGTLTRGCSEKYCGGEPPTSLLHADADLPDN